MPLPHSISPRPRLSIIFLILLGIWLLLSAFGVAPWLATLIAVVECVAAAVLLFQMGKFLVKQSLWRLRNRLILNYILIGVIPVMLILIWVTLGAYFLAGQVAVFLISSELNRHVQELNGPAHILSWSNSENRPRTLNQMLPFVRTRFPSLEIFIQGTDAFRYPPTASLSAPPTGWKDCSGLMLRNGRHYAWAHVAQSTAEVVMVEPITNRTLSELIPNLGAVRFRGGGVRNQDQKAVRVPDPEYWFDPEITWFAQLSVADWNRPNHSAPQLITVTTRPSAVLNQIFGKDFDIAQDTLVGLGGVAVLFLIVEIFSLVTGISLTRSITGAVHNLYEGTQKVTAGDFQHRIEVSGNDQLAELSKSFNSMTENLQRLFVVEKEKERLQSELEIAKGVQFQLFPKDVPTLTNMQLKGVCQPARMVSGDYYDYLCLDQHRVAFAIGDVAGKGISAALLMASIQSIMRTHLAANNDPNTVFSTSRAVFQLNNQLYANTSPEKFATFCFGVYDETLHTLTYTNAGHLPPLLLRKNHAEPLEVTGTVVGAFPKMQFEERTILLEPGDMLAAYTDGIAEPENEYGEEFGVERLTDLLLRYQHTDTGELIARIMEAVQQWTNAPELPDDMTVLIARVQ